MKSHTCGWRCGRGLGWAWPGLGVVCVGVAWGGRGRVGGRGRGPAKGMEFCRHAVYGHCYKIKIIMILQANVKTTHTSLSTDGKNEERYRTCSPRSHGSTGRRLGCGGPCVLGLRGRRHLDLLRHPTR